MVLNVKSIHVATVMSDPEKFILTEQEVNEVVDGLQANGAYIENVVWLAEDRACDIFFANLPANEVRELMTHQLAEVPVDFIVQPTGGRKKRLLMTDMDSTMIQQECIDELADFAGLKAEISAVTERAMNGELEFEDALRERVAMLKGLSEDVLQQAYEKHITFMPGGRELVATMKQHGARAVLVSGGFTFFTSRVKDALGFDMEEANVLNIEDGKLDGTVQEPILGKTAKLNALLFHAEEVGIPPVGAVAVGDGANDLPMLLCAGLGVAYHAKPRVKAEAKAFVDHTDLRSVLYAQGYKDGEIITDR